MDTVNGVKARLSSGSPDGNGGHVHPPATIARSNPSDSSPVTVVNSEKDPLLGKGDHSSPSSAPTEKATWRHWSIGCVAFIYFYGMFSSYYVVVEYTNKRCLVEEFLAANLSERNISSSSCSSNTTGVVYETQTRATERASQWVLYFSLAQGVPAVISNLVLGSYTDTWGRKFLLVIGIVGTTTRVIGTTLVMYLDANLFYIVVAMVIDGCSGQFATCFQATLAYIADITTAKTRSLGMILAEAVVGAGLSGAGLATGYLVHAFGFTVAIVIAAALLVADALLVLFVLPETLGKGKRRKRSSTLQALKVSVLFFIKDDHEKKRWKYQITFLVYFLCNLSYMGKIATETLYQMATPFCWSVEKVGVYAAVRTVAQFAVGLGLASGLRRCLGEITLCMLGVTSFAASLCWTAFVEEDLEWYFIIGIGCLAPVAPSMARSILSLLTPPDKQGAVFSAVAAFDILSSLLSNVINSAIYAATVSTLRGFVFLVLGSYNAVCIVLLIVLKVGWHQEKRLKDSQQGRIQ